MKPMSIKCPQILYKPSRYILLSLSVTNHHSVVAPVESKTFCSLESKKEKYESAILCVFLFKMDDSQSCGLSMQNASCSILGTDMIGNLVYQFVLRVLCTPLQKSFICK